VGSAAPSRRLLPWALCYRGWDADAEPLREALTTLGNGRFATRGAAEEAIAGGPHYPGTYVAGGYDRTCSTVAGRTVENEDLVNWPNWLPLTMRIGDGPWFALSRVQILEYEQRLDLRAGVLHRRVRFRDADDRTTQIDSRRIVHMARPQVAAIEWTLTPLDWSGEIAIRSGLDGRVQNAGVARYRELESQHLEHGESAAVGEDTIVLVCCTRQSKIRMAQAARTHVWQGGDAVHPTRHTEAKHDEVQQTLVVACAQGQPVRVEKIVAICTSRDPAISEPRTHAVELVQRLPDFAALVREHERAWARLWARADLELDTEHEDAQSILRLHVFHILQTASPHSGDIDFGIPARGLHGEAYRGHVFWDELFVFPFLDLRLPEVTRSLLLYRYRRLDAARALAREAGYAGAMFPWQSGSDGREESQVLHLNPESGRWTPDETHRQRHVGAAIAYNVWRYHRHTGDAEFLATFGAPLFLEIARFWASIAEHDDARGRFVIRGVVGPDEFQTGYRGSERPGIDDNAYTNVMAAWVLQTVPELLATLDEDRRTEVLAALEVSDEERRRWDEIGRSLFVPFIDAQVIEQFAGWNALEELDWDGLRREHGNIERLDRLLEAEGDDPRRYKAAKQADVLMLFFVFSLPELERIFARLGYPMSREIMEANVRYYLDRTSHGSTLSRIVHAWVLARLDRAASWEQFSAALESDIDDVQGGTTAEGIHLGAMASTVDLVQRGYTGIELHDDALWLDPQLPLPVQALRLTVRYRGSDVALRITHRALTVRPRAALRLGVRGRVFELEAGEERRFELDDPRRIAAAIFDMDGVLTKTAALHERAWGVAFDRYLSEVGGQPAFSSEDYRAHVDGKPRYEGVADFLHARGLELPWGTPEDAAGTRTVCALGNLKDGEFRELLERGVEVHDDAVAALRRWRAAGLPCAIVTASRNARRVLEAAGLLEDADAIVDGTIGLRTKEELLREAARRIDVQPGEAAVLEDAIAGVRAARKAGFALVVGIDRTDEAHALEDAGAHVVVSDVETLRL
jgi:HAD superfamily hydrolase (TIGR01509 family)